MCPHVLILGGTTEARELALALARRDLYTTMSLAGRTASPAAQPVPVRRGGFGGAHGLAEHIRGHRVDVLIDATHPYARIISWNAVEAAKQTGTPILAVRRPPWNAVDGDVWIDVADAGDAVRELGSDPRRVFLTVGRQELEPFSSAPQHHYFVRSVDPVDPPLAVPHAHYLLARGPFTASDDRELLITHAIDAVVAKNSGGTATYSKIAAARSLGIPVLLFRRPPFPDCPSVASVEKAVEWLDHALGREVPRGV